MIILDAVWGSFGPISKCKFDLDDIVIWGTNEKTGEFVDSSKILLKNDFILLNSLDYTFKKNYKIIKQVDKKTLKLIKSKYNDKKIILFSFLFSSQLIILIFFLQFWKHFMICSLSFQNSWSFHIWSWSVIKYDLFTDYSFYFDDFRYVIFSHDGLSYDLFSIQFDLLSYKIHNSYL